MSLKDQILALPFPHVGCRNEDYVAQGWEDALKAAALVDRQPDPSALIAAWKALQSNPEVGEDEDRRAWEMWADAATICAKVLDSYVTALIQTEQA